ncbi:MAG: hypothetical protein QM638_05710 [Nocardioides sp.]|uniref:hypothetical protein n=1 Tax=Nocardioides sp. TaxID=35761 RepID=UPI0039E50C92
MHEREQVVDEVAVDAVAALAAPGADDPPVTASATAAASAVSSAHTVRSRLLLPSPPDPAS